jgi:hypothetical protein
MKEINKARKIFKGFFPDETVSDKVMEERRSLCGACEYNSVNTPSEKLSPIDYLRSNVTSAFCTLCKCQIKEKTQSPFEECAAYMAGKEKKWFKTRLETMKNEDLNITNVSDVKVDLSLVGNKFVVDYGVLHFGDNTELELLLDINSPDNFKIHSVQPSCGCTVTKYHTIENRGTIYFRLDLGAVAIGKFSKEVSVEYVVGNQPHTVVISLTGFRQ